MVTEEYTIELDLYKNEPENDAVYYVMKMAGHGFARSCGPHDSEALALACADRSIPRFMKEFIDWLEQNTKKETLH